jgi:hypothetical protein
VAQEKQYCNYCQISNQHYVLVIHQLAATGVHRPPWFSAKKKWGGVDPLGNLPDPTVFLNVPHVANKYKLQADTGKVIRIPENHIREVCTFIHNYCPPGGWAASLSTLLGAIYLNRN